MRQCAAWEASGVKVVPRSLRYPREWPDVKPEEKEIDVQIAIDMVILAINWDLDVAIFASTDTDLRPLYRWREIARNIPPNRTVEDWLTETDETGAFVHNYG